MVTRTSRKIRRHLPTLATVAALALSLVSVSPAAAVIDGDDGSTAIGFVSDVSVDGATYDPQIDIVTISGSLRCNGLGFVEIFAEASQSIGRHLVVGAGGTTIDDCEGEQAWDLALEGSTSFFGPGSIDVVITAIGCAPACTSISLPVTVRARPTNNRPTPAPEPPSPPPAPPNDERTGAFPIALGDTVEQDTTGATSADADPDDCPTDPVPSVGASVWYAFTAPGDGFVDVNTFGSDYDPVLFVLDGDELVACSDLAPGGTADAQVIVEALAGTVYHIMVGARADTLPGDLVLSVLETEEPPEPPTPPVPPPNDDRGDAIPLTIGQTLTADTAGATVDLATDPQECPDADLPPSEHTVWYTITPEVAGWVEVNTFATGDERFDTTLYVLLADEVIACNDDSGSLQSKVTFLGAANVTYEVMAGTFDGLPAGTLAITALEGEPTLDVDVTLAPTGSLATRTGAATIGGTIKCSLPATGSLFGSAQQAGGRFLATGRAEGETACGPDPTSWSMTIPGSTSRFQRGTVNVFIEFIVSSEDDQTIFRSVAGEVELRPSGKRSD